MSRAGPARLALVLALLATVACKSSAPYTVPAAAASVGLAAGVSALQRTQGGCYAQCTGGTVCNPVNGFCEQRNVVCLGMESDPPSCLARQAGTMGTSAQVPGPGPGGETISPFGLSPATGSVPPPPSSASPAPTRP